MLRIKFVITNREVVPTEYMLYHENKFFTHLVNKSRYFNLVDMHTNFSGGWQSFKILF
jgi:hypothetical protein